MSKKSVQHERYKPDAATCPAVMQAFYEAILEQPDYRSNRFKVLGREEGISKEDIRRDLWMKKASF